MSISEPSKFIRTLHKMVTDETNKEAIGYSDDGRCLELRNKEILSIVVLPKYFKHGNVASFVRQLNNYGFRTKRFSPSGLVSQVFVHPYFCKGREDLYLHIRQGLASTPNSSNNSSTNEVHTPTLAKESSKEPAVVPVPRKYSYEEIVEVNSELFAQNQQLLSRISMLEGIVQDLLNSNKRLMVFAPENIPFFATPPPPLQVPSVAVAATIDVNVFPAPLDKNLGLQTTKHDEDTVLKYASLLMQAPLEEEEEGDTD